MNSVGQTAHNALVQFCGFTDQSASDLLAGKPTLANAIAAAVADAHPGASSSIMRRAISSAIENYDPGADAQETD